MVSGRIASRAGRVRTCAGTCLGCRLVLHLPNIQLFKCSLFLFLSCVPFLGGGTYLSTYISVQQVCRYSPPCISLYLVPLPVPFRPPHLPSSLLPPIPDLQGRSRTKEGRAIQGTCPLLLSVAFCTM
ncbi:hypothetical protein CH063_06655 [Colletotrichum higginsianum]|uniref:Uncharacterized protein n=1 Tax=Colletotrichum higginsianum (strain IMI 349063) TaxID=759273 RepID=H1V3B9_COLHI|nr:hypothetical protein CH063_06655 [Colletotrichum higginsianum]